MPTAGAARPTTRQVGNGSLLLFLVNKHERVDHQTLLKLVNKRCCWR